MLFENWNESTSAPTSPGGRSRRNSSFGGHSRVSGYEDNAESMFEDVSIFTLDRLHWEPSEDEGAVCSVVVAKNVLLVLTTNRWLVRWDLLNDSRTVTKVSSNAQDEVYKVFTDDSATHILVTFESGCTMYVHEALRRPIPITKLGLIAESVAWIPAQSPSSERVSCLIGARDGSIYELDLLSKDRNLNKLLTLPRNDRVCGIQLHLLPSSSPSAADKWLVMIASPTRLFQLIGGPTMAMLFDYYKDDEPSFIELPGNLEYSELHFYRDSDKRAKSVSWLTGTGLYFGNLSFDKDRQDNTLVEDYRLIPYPMKGALGTPLSMAVTQYHFVFLYKRRVLAINQKSEEIVLDESLPYGYGDMISMTIDPTLASIFMFSSGSVCEIVVEREDRDMWKLYLQDKQFAEALELCSNDDERAEVLNAQGDHLFDQGQYVPAAAIYSRSSRTFEEIALKFISSGARNALKAFLRKRLDLSNKKDVTQRTMMCTWLTELYLDTLGSLRDSLDADVYEDVAAEFVDFLREHKHELDRSTTFELISSHGRVAELLLYAEMIGDREWVVNYHVQHGQYQEALQALVARASSSRSSTSTESESSAARAPDQMYYQFAPVLLEHLPQQTADALLAVRSLDPSRLLPALMRYEGSASAASSPGQNVALNFLEEVIEVRKCGDRAVHNYLVSLLVKLGDNGERLLSFVDAHALDVRFDPKYALRLCHQEGLQRACVRLYVLMGLFAEAVEAALRVDVQLAKQVAEHLDEHHPDHKSIWMKVAQHVMKQSSCSTTAAVELLKQCSCIQLDDLLPFFPDNVRIADLKQEIVDALDSYNERIDALKVEMDEYRRGAEQLREEALSLRDRSAVLSASQPCRFCERCLIDQPFYLFPCQHAFHVDCAISRVQKLRQQLHHRRRFRSSFFDSDDEDNDNDRQEEYQQDQDANAANSKSAEPTDAEVASSSCILCSDLIIDSVDEPFAIEGDDHSWDI